MVTFLGSKSDFDLEGFLRRLFSQKQSYKSIFSSPALVPPWAANCIDLLYSSKSVPPVFPEPDKLYLCYHENDQLRMVGETKSKKRIDRTISVRSEGSSIVVESKHLNFQTQDFKRFEGRGCNLESAMSDYFSKSDLTRSDYKFTIQNVQKDGDAFLLHNTIGNKGYNYLVAKIIEAVKEIFKLVPKDKHVELSAKIEKNFKNISKILNTPENKKIFNHYDPRLWVIVESIFMHFDFQPLDFQRKAQRDHVIAQCCTGLMKSIDVMPRLRHYLSALKMHNELLQAMNQNDLGSACQQLLSEYKKQNLLPEVVGDRETIEEHFKQYQDEIRPKFGPVRNSSAG